MKLPAEWQGGGFCIFCKFSENGRKILTFEKKNAII